MTELLLGLFLMALLVLADSRFSQRLAERVREIISWLEPD